MAYDEELADRIREALGPERGVSEQKMFGGLAFMLGGHLTVAASGQGGLLVRVDPERAEQLLADPGVGPMEMRDREMRGWLRVDEGAVRTTRQLARWVRLATTFTRSLPPKKR